MLLYIIRHGDPIYDPDSLTEKGHRQAEALAPRMAQGQINKIYSSPNGRARMTADPTSRLLDLEYQIEDWMSENYAWRDFSIDIGGGRRTWVFNSPNTKIKTDSAVMNGKEWYEADYIPNKELVKEGYKRISMCSDDYIARLGYVREGAIYRIERPNDDRVAAFCHQGFGMIWLSYLLAVPPHFFWSNFDITHSGVTILEFKNNEDGLTAPKCLCLSDLSHLYKSEIPMLYNNTLQV